MSGDSEAKKLVSVLAISKSITGPRKEALERISCIHYLVQFKKDTTEVWALINLKSEVNVIEPAYVKKLGLWLQ